MSTAEHGAGHAHGAEHTPASAADMREHLDTWHGFMKFVKWGIIGNILILVFLAIFRTHQ